MANQREHGYVHHPSLHERVCCLRGLATAAAPGPSRSALLTAADNKDPHVLALPTRRAALKLCCDSTRAGCRRVASALHGSAI